RGGQAPGADALPRREEPGGDGDGQRTQPGIGSHRALSRPGAPARPLSWGLAMNHPDLDRLTSWVHGFLESADAGEIEDHVAGCAACRDLAEGLREEAKLLSRAIAAPERLSDLKARLMDAAAGKRPNRGLLWQ